MRHAPAPVGPTPAQPRAATTDDARNRDSGVYYRDGHEQSACHPRTPTGAPRASRSGSRAPSHGARGPPPGWRRQAARRRRAVSCRPSPNTSTGAFTITVHQASGRGGAPHPRLLVPRSVLAVAVRPHCSSSSRTFSDRVSEFPSSGKTKTFKPFKSSNLSPQVTSARALRTGAYRCMGVAY